MVSISLIRNIIRKHTVCNLLLNCEANQYHFMNRAYELSAELNVLSIVLDDIPFSRTYIEMPCRKSIVSKAFKDIPVPASMRVIPRHEFVFATKKFTNAFCAMLKEADVDEFHRQPINQFLSEINRYVHRLERLDSYSLRKFLQ